MRYNTNKVDEKVIVEQGAKSYSNGEDVTYSHPSYGQIRVARTQGGGKELFGCETTTDSFISLEISEATNTQDLGRNWYFSTKSIVKVEMSSVQYAEMISNPNTEGVPCTIRYRQDLGYIEYKPHSTQIEYTKQKVKDELKGLSTNLKDKKLRAKEILSQTGSLKKADKEELLNIIQNIDSKMQSCIPFYVKSVEEHIERATMEAKVEAESFITHVQTKLGSTILSNPEAIKLLLEDKGGEQ